MTPRLCIFGDSHYACIRQAETQGLVDMTGLEVEHWGHVGGLFLRLRSRHGVVYSDDERTALRFAKFNEKGRTELVAGDFDAILVMGARTYMVGLFQKLAEVQRSDQFASQGLRLRMVCDHLRRQFGYQLARSLAAPGTTRVFLAPTSFPTENPGDPAQAPLVLGQAGHIAATWDLAMRAARQDGIDLVPQPEETRAGGWLTRADFAVADHVRKRDYAHRNARYGALILQRVLADIRGQELP